MTGAIEAVLDASAVLALLYQEPSGEKVEPYLAHARISSVNFSEVAASMIVHGAAPADVRRVLAALLPAPDAFDVEQAHRAAALISKTRTLGLSLGDRACLALGLTHAAPVLTADRSWAKLKLPGLKILTIR